MKLPDIPGAILGIADWAPYMHWAKKHEKAPFDLTGSNLQHCTLEDLPGAQGVLELGGDNDEGYQPLIEAVAGRYRMQKQCVALAPGASGANFLVIAALIRPGDEVLLERPGYDPHEGAVRLLGGEVRYFSRPFESGFGIDPGKVEEALSGRTRLIVVTNPHNPSGVLADPDALDEVAALARSVGARVLVDEVYLDTLGAREHPPAATRSPTFISTSSLTKSYGLSGLRCGWVLADAEVAEAIRRVRDVVDATSAFPTDKLAVLAFAHIDHLAKRAHEILGPNMALLGGFIAEHEDLDWIPPAGGSVAFPRLRGSEDTTDFVDRLHHEYAVGVVPGVFFSAPRHFRVAVGGKRDVLEGGLDALGRALRDRRAR